MQLKCERTVYTCTTHCRKMFCYRELTILTLALTLAKAVTYRQRSLERIPHNEIPTTEQQILIYYTNNIPALGDGEFSRYPFLHTVRVGGSHVTTVSPTAFNGTVIQSLWLHNNRLTEFPDFLVIAATLQYLYLSSNRIELINQTRLSALVNIVKLDIRDNPLISLPDFADVGSQAAKRRWLFINTVSSFMPVTFCGFTRVTYKEAPRYEVPYLICDLNQTNAIENLYLQEKAYDSNTDFMNLTSFLHPEFTRLNLDYNNFHTDFPNLPNAIRTNLNILHVRHGHMTYISADRLDNYSLGVLNVSYNALPVVPLETFRVASKVMLSHNPWANFTTTYWQEALCHTASQRHKHLDMSNAMPHLAYMRVLKDILCEKDPEYELYLHYITVPCDCTLMWILELRRCGIDVFLDSLPCGADTWDDVNTFLNCSQNFSVILDPNGQSQLTENNFTPNGSVSLIYVQNTQCLVNTLSGDAFIVGPGTHVFSDHLNVTEIQLFENDAQLREVVLPLVRCLDTAPASTPASTPASAPANAPVLALTDGSSSTCLSIHHTSVFMPITTQTPIHTSWAYFSITTRHMDCSHPFHVLLVTRFPCNPSLPCVLVSQIEEDGGFMSCRFRCESSDEGWRIRLAHVRYGEVCDIILEP